MGDVPVGGLAILLLLLLCLSAFFSGTETALMSVDRYRLRHLAREGSQAARMMERLLERPDRLIGTSMPISAIAAEAGFADQAHLTRWFRRVMGVTPAAYRLARRR